LLHKGTYPLALLKPIVPTGRRTEDNPPRGRGKIQGALSANERGNGMLTRREIVARRLTAEGRSFTEAQSRTLLGVKKVEES